MFPDLFFCQAHLVGTVIQKHAMQIKYSQTSDWHHGTDVPLPAPVEACGPILADTDLIAAVVPLLALGVAAAVHHTHRTCGVPRATVT